MIKLKSQFEKFSSILGINLLITLGIFSIAELILSKYFINSPAYNVPETLIDYKLTFDNSKIDNLNKKVKVKYSRDSNGYRPFKNLNDKNEIILTIGGSTTDQKFLDNSKTWQAIMEKYGNISVINGGVDGQSTYGHLVAIRKWHSKVLNPNKIDKILFYLGVNDIRFSKSLDASRGNIYDSPTLIRRLRTFLQRRSFLYSKLKEVKYKLDILVGKKFISPIGVFIVGHGISNPTFLTNPELSNIRLSSLEESKEYEELFRELIVTTRNNFTKSEILIVQQQDPRCLITKDQVFVRTMQDGIKAYCSALASIFVAQDQAISKLDLKNIDLIKMYKENPIPDKGFYDGLHTNSFGSLIIGKYLLDKLY